MQQKSYPPEAFTALVEGAVERILLTEDLNDFLGWFKGRVYEQSLLAGVPLDRDGAKLLAVNLGRSIWGATPGPHNDFEPRALPTPGRNAPCFCGSGLKYKRCCGIGPRLPTMDSASIWPFVLETLPRKTCKEIVVSGRVPVESLLAAADEFRRDGRPKRALDFLEPLFGTKIAGRGKPYASALMLLCDLYDELGWTGKKTRLLERLRAELPRSPLRSDASQRFATILMDRGDSAGAWDAFRQAQRDAPNDPLLGLLEVQLLLADNRYDAARDRANFWRKRLERMNDGDLDGLVEFLAGVTEDPFGTFTQKAVEEAEGAGERLLSALRGLDERPIPDYRIVADSAREPSDDPETAVVRQLRGMGVLEEDIPSAAAKLLQQMETLEPVDEPGADESADRYILLAPDRLRTLEADWHAIYEPGKPMSIDQLPRGYAYPWEMEAEDAWMSFLERHPEAFDSIDILDDLATAVELHPMCETEGVRETMQRPLVERGVDILRQAVQTAGLDSTAVLPWLDVGNRPALRCLERAHGLAVAQGDVDRARELGELLVELNPNDNHGVRTALMNSYLRDGLDEAAVSLASRYEDDMFAELLYGQVLALVRLKRTRAAVQAAQRAVDWLPEVRRFLTRLRARQPRLDPHGVRIGSKEQAWLYRDEMRDVWVGEPDAMELIRRTKPSKGSSGL